MLDACPHHHEEPAKPVSTAVSSAAADSAGAEGDLAGLSLRAPGSANPLKGKRLWRSLDELASTPAFQQMLHREFPHAASEWNDGASRRNFLKMMSASLALAGLSACTLRKTPEKIVPYVEAPEEVIPGRPLFFASTMPWCGYGKGVVVESHEGRPTKIEGNVDHPASLGGSDIWMQASVLEMYDPDRSQVVMHGDSISSWGNFQTLLADTLAAKKSDNSKGSGLRFLTGAVTSPTIARQMKAILTEMPNAKWHQYEAIGRQNARAGAIAAFGEDVETLYRFDRADVVVALDSNFLIEHPGSIPYARQFIDRRRLRGSKQVQTPFADASLSRLYVAETSISLTGAQADHRLAIKSGEIEALAREIAAVLSGATASGPNAKWATAVAKDLKTSTGRSLVVVGESQPPAVHALAHSINSTLGNVGKTVNYIDPVEVTGPGGAATLDELVEDINTGLVDVLVIIGTNPTFSAPRNLGLAEGLNEKTESNRSADYTTKNPLSKVPLVIHHGLYNRLADETANFAHWHIPASHYLESWGDLRAFDGTASIVQPLIYPLYTTKSEIELLAYFAGESDTASIDLVRKTWSKLSDDDWQRALEKGVIPNTAFATKSMSPRSSLEAMYKTGAGAGSAGKGLLEIVFKPDPSLLDGRFANNGWLQEVPKPVSLLTWDNVAMMSVNTARRLNVSQDDAGKGLQVPLVNLTVNRQTLAIPAMIMPGHADDSITVYLGFGRTRCGRIGNGVGCDSQRLRASSNTWFASDLAIEVQQDGSTYSIATSQSHHLIDLPAADAGKLDSVFLEDRDLVQNFTISEVKAARPSKRKIEKKLSLPIHKEKSEEEENETLLPAWKYEYNKWGMVIDNQACIGCNACVVACQSENNIPLVGKEQVLKGREMHWLRIDTYFLGEDASSPEVYMQPIPCMQCENAPCELVCPVEATTTSSEGINEQTYNRCVGTRYCSNNCPYKVRRFNFLYYSDYETPQYMLQKNPNVTVRARGIMEKCNYCVQRVNNSRIEAKKQDRPINPGDVVTACAQACPTHAITFGNLNDGRWEVTQLQDEPLRFTLLDELNTLPRTSYLARVRNPNPELA
jgi:molybdopterin-containing oxidoreductase family iron-sulfur binding subunit